MAVLVVVLRPSAAAPVGNAEGSVRVDGGAADVTGRSDGERSTFGRTPIDAVVLAALFSVSVVVRAPYLQVIPRFTDEVRRVLWSMRILEGDFWPLAYKNGYNGALMIYLKAAALAVHPGLSTPRWTAVLVASIAPPALYLLGRELHSRSAGIIAGALLATSFVPVVIYGHIPWAISLAATLVVVGQWLVVRGSRRRSAPSLLLGAAIFGLALQTHPLSFITLPGVLVWLGASARRDGWPGRRVVAGALTVAALAFAPLVLHHAIEFGRDGQIEVTSTRDLRDGFPALSSYPAGARAAVGAMVDTLSGEDHTRSRPRRVDPFAWLIVVMAVGSLAAGAWRGPRLPALATASGLLILPLLVQTFNFPLSMRYTGLLLPTIYLGIGWGLAAAWKRAGDGAGRIATGALTAALVALVALVSTARIQAFYAHDMAREYTNHEILALAEAARDRWSDQGGDLPALIIDDVIDAKYAASGNISRVLEMLLGLHRVPIVKVSSPQQLDDQLRKADGPRVIIVSDAMRDAAALGAELDQVDGAHVPPGGDGDGFGLYQWPGTTAMDGSGTP